MPLLGHSDSGGDNDIGDCGIPEVVLAAREWTTDALARKVGCEDGDALGGEGCGERAVIANGHAQSRQQDDDGVARASAVDADDRRVSPAGQVQVSHVIHESTVCRVAKGDLRRLSASG